MTNIWIVWLIATVFGITFIGLNKRFVVTIPDGRNVVADRFSFKTVKYSVRIFTVVFALLLGGDDLLYTLSDARYSFVLNFAFWVLCRMPFILLLVVVYRCLICFLYNYGRKGNDVHIKKELAHRQIAGLVRKPI